MTVPVVAFFNNKGGVGKTSLVYHLAWMYADGGEKLDEALKLAQTATQAMPDVPELMDTLGWVYYKKGLTAVAIEQLQKAVALDDVAAKNNNANPSPVYRYHLGMALKAKGDKDGARALPVFSLSTTRVNSVATRPGSISKRRRIAMKSLFGTSSSLRSQCSSSTL